MGTKGENEDVWFVLETGKTKGTMLRRRECLVGHETARGQKKRVWILCSGKNISSLRSLGHLLSRSTKPKSEWHIYILNGLNNGIKFTQTFLDPRRNNRRVEFSRGSSVSKFVALKKLEI